MTLFELPLIDVVGFMALGVAALVAALMVARLKRPVARVDTRTAASRTAPRLHGDARDTARLIDRRQAAWRLRC